MNKVSTLKPALFFIETFTIRGRTKGFTTRPLARLRWKHDSSELWFPTSSRLNDQAWFSIYGVATFLKKCVWVSEGGRSWKKASTLDVEDVSVCVKLWVELWAERACAVSERMILFFPSSCPSFLFFLSPCPIKTEHKQASFLCQSAKLQGKLWALLVYTWPVCPEDIEVEEQLFLLNSCWHFFNKKKKKWKKPFALHLKCVNLEFLQTCLIN